MSLHSVRRTTLIVRLACSALLAAATLGLTIDCAAAAEPSAAAPVEVKVDDKLREDVKTMPLEMARIMEAKQYKLCIETFFDPDAVKKQAAVPGGLDTMAKDFAEVAPTFVKLLKATKGVEPKLQGTDKASFELPLLKDPQDGTPVVQLKKVGKYWYFGD